MKLEVLTSAQIRRLLKSAKLPTTLRVVKRELLKEPYLENLLKLSSAEIEGTKMDITQLEAVKCRLTAYTGAFEKRLPGQVKATTPQGLVDQGNDAGRACTYGGKVVNFTAWDLMQHSGRGNAIAVGVYANNHRIRANILEQNLIGLDFENGGITYDDILADDFIMAYASVVMSTASNTPENPRNRVFIFLDRSVNGNEARAILNVFYERYAGKLDTKASDGARLFFGAYLVGQDCWYNNDALLRVDEFLLKHECAVIASAMPLERATRTATPKGAASETLPPTDMSIRKVYCAIEKILKWHSDRGLPIGAVNDLSFNKLVWAAAAATNRDAATKELLRNDSSWQLVNATKADYVRFDKNFDETEVYNLSAGSIFFWAGQLC